MALLTTIGGQPLYSTTQEAIAWGASRGLTGFHTHTYQGQVGYMGGATHGAATNTSNNNLPSARSSSGGNGSSGGGY